MRVVRKPVLRGAQSIALDDDLVIEADCADVLGRLPDGAFDLVYIDPPFNTGRRREHRRLRTVRDERDGARRFEILYGLDLNLAYVRGAKYVHPLSWTFDYLIPVGASSVRPER